MIDLNKPSKDQEYAKAQIKGEIKPPTRVSIKGFYRHDSTWIAKGIKFKVDYLRNNRLSFARQDKLHGIQWLCEVFPEAVKRILAGENFNIETYQTLGYYKYLTAQLNPICHEIGYDFRKAIKHNWDKKFWDLIRLCSSIKDNGLLAPLDMFIENGYLILIRGHRRLEILYQLGVKEVPVRVWRNEWLSKHFIPTAKWNLPGNSIHGTAIKQFIKYGYKATDKYWVHGYTTRYDGHLQGRLSDKLKVLELGVKEGMSMDLWRKSFTRAHIYGIDIKPDRQWRKLVDHDRIHLFNFDYTNPMAIKQFARQNGAFDIIIDDGIHKPIPQRDTFKLLWPYLNNNGIYVIEDLHPNYREKPEGMATMNVFKNKIDKIWTNHAIKSVAFYPNICFIEKA